MSNNYYLRFAICGCCDRYDEIHIGGYSRNLFTFQAYSYPRNWATDSADESPFGFPIKVKTDWAKVFDLFRAEEIDRRLGRNFEIRDEYGARIWENPHDWLDHWQPDSKENYDKDGKYYDYDEERNDYLDPQGYRFITSQFS